MNREQATIMVVDDMPANLNLLREMLQVFGYRIQAFPRGAMALRAATAKPPDLILLDINMPEMNGFEVCRHLKADKVLKDIPVIFISALTDTAEKVKAFSLGGVDYVTKPFQIEEVHARVETHLRIRWLQRELAKHNQDLENLVRQKMEEISSSHLATIMAVSKLAEQRDDDTGQHIERTRTLCRMVAKTLQNTTRYAKCISEAFIRDIYHASPLHDIGKVGIPDHILLKPGSLTREEFDIMKTHSQIGADTLKMVQDNYSRNSFINMGVALTRSHHEKWDGSGYPEGLIGEDIPLSARIMAIVDVYDALRSRRPYKEAFSHEKSMRIIRESAGRHFDPIIVKAFEVVVNHPAVTSLYASMTAEHSGLSVFLDKKEG